MVNLHDLTVQDMLWVNLQATKKVQHFNYAMLEEATAYQYAYGESASLIPQAGRFLTGFLKLHPFETGNESTGLVACATFLKVNGSELNVEDSDAEAWLDKVMTKQITGVEAVHRSSETDPHFHDVLKPDSRSAIRAIVEKYQKTMLALSHRSAVAK
jgi:prophage maintenance system killer protein